MNYTNLERSLKESGNLRKAVNMDIVSTLFITQIPYYIVLFFAIREIRKLKKYNLKTLIY